MRRWVLGAVVVVPMVLAALALAWWLDLRSGEPTPFSTFAVDGSRVEVSYVGSSCQDGSRLEVTEEAARVVLTVRAWELSGSCDDVGVDYRLRATLEEPLGTREVVDGACLDERFAGYTDCAGP